MFRTQTSKGRIPTTQPVIKCRNSVKSAFSLRLNDSLELNSGESQARLASINLRVRIDPALPHESCPTLLGFSNRRAAAAPGLPHLSVLVYPNH